MIATTPDHPPTLHSAPPAPSGPNRRRAWVSLGAAALLLSALLGAALLPVPYLAVRPGSVLPVAEQVTVDGAEAHPPEGSIAFTTVNVGSTSLLEAFLGWLDDDVDVFPEERIRGDRSPSENRRYNAQLMDTSKAVAVTVALEHLGYDVAIQTSGTVVRRILEGSPAASALELDDVVVAVDGSPITHADDLRNLLQVGGPGASHTLTVERPAGSDTRVDVTLSTVAAEDEPSRAVIGIVPEERITGFDHPISVTIDSGNVGGPSAGLAFALAVIDVLTPGELTGGRRVAVTGTMSLDGTVGPVGGGAQKAVAVRDAGYEVFLVPSDELEEVEAAVGDDLTVIAVGTLAEALEALGATGVATGS